MTGTYSSSLFSYYVHFIFPPQTATTRATTSKTLTKIRAKSSPKSPSQTSRSPLLTRGRRVTLVSTALSVLVLSNSADSTCWSKPDFFELPNSGGVKVLDLRIGDGQVPVDGDQVAIHYYGRLAAKQGWRFDSTYDHKDETGEPIPFVFLLGSGKERKYFIIHLSGMTMLMMFMMDLDMCPKSRGMVSTMDSATLPSKQRGCSFSLLYVVLGTS